MYVRSLERKRACQKKRECLAHLGLLRMPQARGKVRDVLYGCCNIPRKLRWYVLFSGDLFSSLQFAHNVWRIRFGIASIFWSGNEIRTQSPFTRPVPTLSTASWSSFLFVRSSPLGCGEPGSSYTRKSEACS